MRKFLLTILLTGLYFASSHAQISYGGTPPSFDYPQVMRSAGQVYQVPVSTIDVKELIRQDEIAEANGSPMRIAVGVAVDVDINTTGEWMTLPGSQRIWKQTLSAPGAKGIILAYESFSIPEGGQLFIYNGDRSQILGAFTEKTNPRGGKFSTRMVYGEEITLEYVESSISNQKPSLKIEDIGYVYFRSEEEERMFRTSPSPGYSSYCMIDINCPEGDNWQDQKRGVVQIHYKDTGSNSWFDCSGSLINTTANDATPYVLTASHCFFIEDPRYTGGEFETAQFYFNYEAETCGQRVVTIPDYTTNLVGSELMTYEEYTTGADGLLLLLDEEVPLEWQPYFNGWDRSGVTPERGVIIHHPSGDIKKISTYITPPTEEKYPGGLAEDWWVVNYATTKTGRSVTSGGSSGSPMFNQDRLIVGSLTGGNSQCGDERGKDLYGKFSEHFAGGTTSNGMASYLDPLNTGVIRLEGYDPNRDVSIQQERKDVSPELVVFPNPAETEININAGSIIRKVYVFDMRGQQLHETTAYTSSTFTLDVSPWQKGIYTIVTETENGKFIQKFVKQ